MCPLHLVIACETSSLTHEEFLNRSLGQMGHGPTNPGLTSPSFCLLAFLPTISPGSGTAVNLPPAPPPLFQCCLEELSREGDGAKLELVALPVIQPGFRHGIALGSTAIAGLQEELSSCDNCSRSSQVWLFKLRHGVA